jgi:hypothetical protein
MRSEGFGYTGGVHLVAVNPDELVHATDAAAAELREQNHAFNVVVPERVEG